MQTSELNELSEWNWMDLTIVRMESFHWNSMALRNSNCYSYAVSTVVVFKDYSSHVLFCILLCAVGVLRVQFLISFIILLLFVKLNIYIVWLCNIVTMSCHIGLQRGTRTQ